MLMEWTLEKKEYDLINKSNKKRDIKNIKEVVIWIFRKE